MASRQPHPPPLASPPCFMYLIHKESFRLETKAPFAPLTRNPQVQSKHLSAIFSFTLINPPDAYVHWCPVKHTWKSCPYVEGHAFRHFHHEVEATGFQSGEQFYCLPGTSQNACCQLLWSKQGSYLGYHVFSCNWKVKLKFARSTDEEYWKAVVFSLQA